MKKYFLLYKQPCRENGFTLLEILVVIAILGLIAAVVIPSVLVFMDSADEPSFHVEKKGMQRAVTGLMALVRTDTLKGDYVDDGQWHNAFKESDLIYAENDDGLRLDFTEVISPYEFETAYWYQFTSSGKVHGTITKPAF